MSDLTSDEFYDVYRVFRPEATRDEFAAEWARFQEAKAERLRKKAIQ